MLFGGLGALNRTSTAPGGRGLVDGHCRPHRAPVFPTDQQMPKRAREIEIESLQAKCRRVVFEFGAVATLRQLVGIGNRWLEQVIRGVLDVAGNLTRPRLEEQQIYQRSTAGRFFSVLWWGGTDPYRARRYRRDWKGSYALYREPHPQSYSGGRGSRLPYANPP